MQSTAYDVFVSYARNDWHHATEIDSVLRARNLTAFFDRRSLPPGLSWVRQLEIAMNAARAAIILIGSNGLGNTQQYERDLALYRQTRDPTFPIIPVILPEAHIDRPFNFLQILTWVDFSRVARVSDAPGELDRLVAAVQGTHTSAGDTVENCICPYRGLDAFREEDSGFFFGRGDADDPESPIGQLVNRIREHPFVMVVGRSGSGKSSLIKAGLLPALRRERSRFWDVLCLQPGLEPLRALGAAFNQKREGEGVVEYASRISREVDELRSCNIDVISHVIRHKLKTSEGQPDRLLLYIDQWEELYSFVPSDPIEKHRRSEDVRLFIDLLLKASEVAPVSIVGTVRADFYDELIGHQGMRALLPSQQILLGAMSRSELESTVVKPANIVGLCFDPPEIVQWMLDDAGENEGMLPLLQYALKETWTLREANVLTGDAYTRSGGVREAIRRTADKTFNDLSPEDRLAARKLFLRLVTPGEGQEHTRARATMPDDPSLRRIVEMFAGPRTRLLTTGGAYGAERPTVEVAHEALIRTWPLLRGWVEANREKLRTRAAILQAKAVWEEQNHREDLLLPAGFHLIRGCALITDPGEIATDDIKDFVNESQRADEREREAGLARERQREAAERASANTLAVSAEREKEFTHAQLLTDHRRLIAASASGILTLSILAWIILHL